MNGFRIALVLGVLAAPAAAQPGPDPIVLAASPGQESALLTWTMPDSHYADWNLVIVDIYCSETGEILQEDIDSGAAAYWAQKDSEEAPGTPQSLVVGGLPPGRRVWLAAVATNMNAASSPVSNSVPVVATADITPPAPITDLAATAPSTHRVILTWTSPGDDGMSGICAGFDLRYSTLRPILTEAEFAAALPVSPAPVGGDTGPRTFFVDGLPSDTDHFFCIRATDGTSWNGLSNVASVRTLPPEGALYSWNDEGSVRLPRTASAGWRVVPTGDPDLLAVFASSEVYHFHISTQTFDLDPETKKPTVVSRIPTTAGVMNDRSTVIPVPGTSTILSLGGEVFYYPPYYSVPAPLHCSPDGGRSWSAGAGFPGSTTSKIHLVATRTTLYALAEDGESAMSVPLNAAGGVDPSSTWEAIRPPLRGINGAAYPGSGDVIFAVSGPATWKYSIANDSWTVMPYTSLPRPPGAYFAMTPGPGGDLYAITGNVTVGSSFPDGAVLFRMSTSQGWFTPSIPNDFLGSAGPGMSLAWPGTGDRLYFMPGGGPNLVTYSTTSHRLVAALTPLPPPPGAGSSMVSLDSRRELLVMAGGRREQWRYSILRDTWTPMTPPPADPAGPWSTTYDGADTVYVVQEGSAELWSYSLALDAWTRDPALLAPLPEPLKAGGRICWGGPDRLFLYTGSETSTFHFYCYTPSTRAWDERAALPAERTIHKVSSLSWAAGTDALFAFATVDSRIDSALLEYSAVLDRWTVHSSGEWVGGAQPLWYWSSVAVDGDTVFIAGPDQFSAYSRLRDQWTDRALPPLGVQAGFQLVAPGNDPYLYALEGGDSRFLRRFLKPSAPPAPPAELRQFRLDGTTPVTPEHPTVEGGIVLSARVSDPDGNPVALEVRFKPVGVAFDGWADARTVEGPSGSVATLRLDGLAADISYRWEARNRDALGNYSAWIPFGSPAIGDRDFATKSDAAPQTDLLSQASYPDLTAIETGAMTRLPGILLAAQVLDPEGDVSTVEFQVVADGAPWSEAAGVTSAITSSGARASVVLSLDASGRYLWRCRARDSWGVTGAWSVFSHDSAFDLQLEAAGSSAVSSCFSSALTADSSAGLGAILAGLLACLLRRRLVGRNS